MVYILIGATIFKSAKNDKKNCITIMKNFIILKMKVISINFLLIKNNSIKEAMVKIKEGTYIDINIKNTVIDL